jgi:hypothetical protein
LPTGEEATRVTDDYMADHWWWRRGWRPGRRKYTWHFTFDGKPEVHGLAASYQARLAAQPGLDPVPVTLGPALVTPEAILLDITPADGLSAIRHELRQAISDVLGQARLTGGDEWAPHVSVAYSHGTGPQAPLKAAVEGGETAATVINTVQLLVLGRDNRLYEWTTRGGVELGRSRGPSGHPTKMQNG